MADTMERQFPGRDSTQIFDRLVSQLGEIASRYALEVESDRGQLCGRVHRPGADVKFGIVGDRLDIAFAFSFLIPGPIRQKVKDELGRRLDALFADEA